MRLTLRTLLAYLDDILEPTDAESLRKKVDESKFATELVQRTRDVVRRLRLPAPPLDARGLAGDANSVAEYLDNTLPGERVADFEKVCLESDSHLAEVAACHQILTLVLGEPADVDPASRERIYGVIERADGNGVAPAVTAPPAGSEPVAPPAHVSPEPFVMRRQKPEVPEYLRESRSRFWPVAAVLLIAACLTSGILALIAPPQLREMAANWFQKGKDDQTNIEPPTVVGEKKPTPDAGSSKERPEKEPFAVELGKPGPLDEPLDNRSKTPSPNPDGPSGTPDIQEPAKLSPPKVAFTKPVPVNDADNPLAPEPSDTPLVPPPGPKMPVEPGPEARTPVPGPLDPLPVKPAVPPEGPAAPPAPPAGTPPVERPEGASEGIGRYLSAQDVLLKLDPTTNSWKRLPGKAALLASDRLLSLPAFRPTLTLVTGVSVQCIGPADFEFSGLDAQGVPGVAVASGRLGLVTIGRAGNMIRLQLGNLSGLVTFLDAESALAVEVRHVLVPGKDPELEPAYLAVDLYATSGQVRWETEGQSITVAAPTGRHLSPAPVEDIDGNDQPKWIASDNLSEIERRAAASLEHDLTLEKPVSLSLKELSENRRSEVRTLAVRCSAYIGEFEPFVASLNDAEQRAEWPKNIEALRNSMALSPEAAARVRQAFEKHRGAEAPELYRMLWGYSSTDIKDGVLTKLVEYLNHDSLDYRVLSFWNLQQLTGLTLFYRPESPVAKRRPQYLKWKERLKEGKLVPVAAATKVGAAKSVRPATEPE